MMTVQEVSELCGVSVRTLHYYDQIGLLAPDGVTPAGYRLYGEAALGRLQQIMFLRELDFPLAEIRGMLASAGYDRIGALSAQRELLSLKLERTQKLIALIDRTLSGDNTETEFKEFDMSKIEQTRKKYAEEVKQRWGDTEQYAQSEAKNAKRTGAQNEAMEAEADAIMDGFAALVGTDPAGEAAQAQVEKWRQHISAHYYECSVQILGSLGLMYTGDPRFTENIDAHGAGTAQFMADAISAYCARSTR